MSKSASELNSQTRELLIELASVSRTNFADPKLTQAAGGNVSVKINDTLWIKASGVWLSRMSDESSLVPVSIAEIESRIDAHNENLKDLSYQAKVPSIETFVHAVIPFKYVIHLHAIDSISHLIYSNWREVLAQKLTGQDWGGVGYVKPGLPLAKELIANKVANKPVIFLGNHGIICSGDSLNAALELLFKVLKLIELPEAPALNRQPEAVRHTVPNDYEEVQDAELASLCYNSLALDILAKGALYPDHVVFLGAAACVVQSHDELTSSLINYHQSWGTAPKLLILKDSFVALRTPVNESMFEMLRAFTQVMRRINGTKNLNFLSTKQIAELLNWDAEKYRQKLAQ